MSKKIKSITCSAQGAVNIIKQMQGTSADPVAFGGQQGRPRLVRYPICTGCSEPDLGSQVEVKLLGYAVSAKG